MPLFTPVRPEEATGIEDLSRAPESTGVEKLVLKRGNLFVVTSRLGDIAPRGARDQGFYCEDTRHLSYLCLRLAGAPAVCLSSQTASDSITQIDLTVTNLEYSGVFSDPINFLHLRREQIIDGMFIDRLRITNYLARPLDYWVELEFAADFVDQFEARGVKRDKRGQYFEPVVDDGRVRLAYQGLDGFRYETWLRFPSPPTSLTGGRARFEIHLEPNATTIVETQVVPRVEGKPHARIPAIALPSPAACVPVDRPHLAFEERVAGLRSHHRAWFQECSAWRTSDETFDVALHQAISDLDSLNVDFAGRRVASAGVPWYSVPFGRDSIWTALMALPVNPRFAKDALLFLAAYQGRGEDRFREEWPGKILHEVRRGEMARCLEIPHTPYYGSVDSTPLFLVLLSEYFLWTEDRDTVSALLPAAEAALHWLDEAGDRDGDGFIEYQRDGERGLENQGWKDSRDGVPWPDGRAVAAPVALVEVQGYAYDARRRMAQLYRRLGHKGPAAALAEGARALARRIDDAFWDPEIECYALALDAQKRRVGTLTSNAGHLLFSRAVPEARARAVTRAMLSPSMYSGWGIRTLGRGQRAYNPLSYHNGTVWPHDNAIVAMGMAQYGMGDHAAQVLTGLFEAVKHFRLHRVPELFCGLSRGEGDFPVNYPVACSPQAWSAGSFFMLLRAVLGIHPDASHKRLRVINPRLPPWLEELEVRGMRIGQSRVSLHFRRTSEGCFATVTEIQGERIQVRIDIGTHGTTLAENGKA